MCNRVATPNADQIKGFFNKVEPDLRDLVKIDKFFAYFHATAFTMPLLPFVGNDDPLHITTAMWKFIPERSSLEAYKPYDTYNAKAEEIFDKRTYKDYIIPKRGLLILTGFYEGQEQPDKTSQPFYIYPQDGGLLTLGCVYSDWYNKEADKQVKTFSIITTAANELMAEIHNKKKRMPLIVPPEKRDWWLSKELTKAELESYFVPYPDGYLKAHKVSRDLYKRGVDSNTIAAQMAI
jgi:putative SOS response-associated peptidase YedK